MADTQFSAGGSVGHWILERPLGEGGMGQVLLARHDRLGTPAAVKVLDVGLSRDSTFCSRFEREAKTQGELRHPHIASLLDYFEVAGRWVIVMAYCAGGSLEDRMKESDGPLPLEQALPWVLQALDGLGHAHDKGVVHRDVKPANILLDEHGRALVADFGIARPQDDLALTSTGTTVGTPRYMSPEQVRASSEVDHRTDIYSMGVVLYELLVGRAPFSSDSQFDVLSAHVRQTPPPPRSLRPEVPAALEAIVLEALAKDPDERFQDCAAMAEALGRWSASDEGGSTAPGGATFVEGRTVHEPTPSPEAQERTVLFSDSIVDEVDEPERAPEPESRRRSGAGRGVHKALLAAGLVVGVGALGGLAYYLSGSLDEPAGSPEAAAGTLADQADEAESLAREVEAAARRAMAQAQVAEERAGLAREAWREGSGSGAAHVVGRCVEEARGAGAAARVAAREASAEAARAQGMTQTVEAIADRVAAGVGGEGGRVWLPPAGRRSSGLAALLITTSSGATPPAGATGATGASGHDEMVERIRRSADQARTAADEADAAAARAADRAAEANRLADELDARLVAMQNNPAPPPSGRQVAGGGASPPGPAPGSSGSRSTGTPLPTPPPPTIPTPQPQPPTRPVPSPTVPPGGPPPGGHDRLRVAVIVRGDPVFAGALEETLEQRLGQRFELRDEYGSLEVAELVDAHGTDLSVRDLREPLLREGISVLVLGQVRELPGPRRGGSTSAQARLNAYLLPTGQSLGAGWTERVRYTELSAPTQARQALLGATVDLGNAIDGGWRAHRASGSPP